MSDKSTSSRLLTAVDAARVIGVCTRTVARLVERGLLRVTAETPAGYRLFHPDEVDRARRERLANPPRVGRPRKQRAGPSGSKGIFGQESNLWRTKKN